MGTLPGRFAQTCVPGAGRKYGRQWETMDSIPSAQDTQHNTTQHTQDTQQHRRTHTEAKVNTQLYLHYPLKHVGQRKKRQHDVLRCGLTA